GSRARRRLELPGHLDQLLSDRAAMARSAGQPAAPAATRQVELLARASASFLTFCRWRRNASRGI
ncbi:MAG: hypothetical protein ACK2UC_06815, partial [Anaerolineae bacterium]